jgi:hypothetical protein
MKKLLTSISVLAVSSLLTVAAKAQPNLLVAGDFEGISSLTTYWPATTGVWGTESSALSGAGNGITPFGSQMLLINHAGGGTASQTAQIVQGPFAAGSVVTFTAKFNTWLTGQSVRLDIMTNAGLALDGTRYSSPYVGLDSDTSTWQTVTATTTLTSATNYLAAEIILAQGSNGALYGQPRAYADDAVLTVVPPTPGTNWVNWTGSETTGGVTKYVGQIVVPRTGGGSTTVNVKFTPPNQWTDGWSPSTPGIAFIQTTGSTDYYAQGNAGSLGRNPARSPYTSAKVTTIPDGGGGVNDKGDIIALRWAGTNTLEFTDASTGLPIAIASPVFAYVSLNGNGYGFNQDFDILSFGDGTVRDQGYFGAGSSYKSTAVVGGVTQYQLLQVGSPTYVTEPHGALQFRGSFSTVTWQSLSNEFWNGFTIGVAQLAADVPIANAGPDQTVNATSPSGATVNLSGSVSGSTAAPFTYRWTGPFGSVTGQNPAVTMPVGNNQTVTLYVTDAAGSTDSDTVLITVLNVPAPVITSSATASGTYGAPFSYTITATNSPTSFGATNLPAGLTLSGAVISGTPTETGSFGVNLSAQNSGGTGTRTLLLTIAKANATINVTGYTGTYDGAAHGATGTATGVGGANLSASLNLGASFTDAPGGTASWTFAGGLNYNNASGSVAITINKANAAINVSGYTGTYDGAAHGATGTATGVGGANLSASLNLGASFTDAPGGTANWSFAGGTNYNNASGSVPITINKANATINVSGYTGTYDGAAHGATGTATGVGGVGLGGLDLGASFTNAPGGTANWSFAGGTNYNNASGSVAITINKANASVVVAPYTVTYDGQPHSATVTSISGVNGESGATVGAVTLNTTHTAAGTYADSWSFTGATNYNDIASTTITNTINKATATVVVAPYSVTYDGQPHSATVTSISGVNGESGATVGAVTLNTTHTNAGTYADSWSFTGAANYNDIASTPITNTINKATATVVVAPYSVTYDGQPHSATVTSISGVNGESGATVGAVTLNTTHTNAGTYATDSWSFTGAANYNDIASTTITNTINKANATINVSGYTGTYDGAAHGATGTAAGVGGANLSGSLTLGANFTNVPGGTANWSFAGGTNYNDANGSVAITINKATATVVVAPYTVTYDGQPHSATVTSITGVNGESGATVGAVTLNTTHTAAGTYADSWSFTGTGNYNNIGATPITDTINKAATSTTLGAVPTVQVVGQSVTLTATVAAQTPVVGAPDGTVTFTIGSTALGTAPLNASGVATLTTTAIPVGPQSITATYGGSSNFNGSTSGAASVLVYAFAAGGGTFVIGDRNATVGASVNFWGSQWERNNSLSGGASNSSFKGFAVRPTTPTAGATFTALPGNSGAPPATVPAYLGVIVTDRVTKSGANITGTIGRLVVVRVNPGYAGDPSNPGTGTVVAAIP